MGGCRFFPDLVEYVRSSHRDRNENWKDIIKMMARERERLSSLAELMVCVPRAKVALILLFLFTPFLPVSFSGKELARKKEE